LASDIFMNDLSNTKGMQDDSEVFSIDISYIYNKPFGPSYSSYKESNFTEWFNHQGDRNERYEKHRKVYEPNGIKETEEEIIRDNSFVDKLEMITYHSQETVALGLESIKNTIYLEVNLKEEKTKEEVEDIKDKIKIYLRSDEFIGDLRENHSISYYSVDFYITIKFIYEDEEGKVDDFRLYAYKDDKFREIVDYERVR
jgi:hypothetical protein